MVLNPTPPRAVTPKPKIHHRECHRSQTALALLGKQHIEPRPTAVNHNRRTSTVAHLHASRNNLPKKWPVDTTMTQPLPAQLRRYPSASQSPSAPSDSTESRDYHPPPSSHTSSNSVYELPANSTASKYSPQPPSAGHANRARDSACQSLNEKSSDEAISALSGLSKVNSTKASGYQNSLRRPGPPPLSQTTSDVRTMNPSLRQSASFSIGDRTSDTTPPPPGSGVATPKRYSDEARNAAPWKKKSSFSSFMTTVLGSPRNFKISNPENPVHVTHVGFDNETGQFTVSRTRLNQLRFEPSYCWLRLIES